MGTFRLSVIASSILMAAAIFDAVGQTTRINCGVRSDGYVSFKEVYELDYVEEKPEFSLTGETLLGYINRERNYPAEAYAKGIEGRVTCSFVVNPDGSVSNVTVLKGVDPALNREAVRILSAMPCWRPGRMAGQPVPVRVVCSVPFRR